MTFNLVAHGGPEAGQFAQKAVQQHESRPAAKIESESSLLTTYWYKSTLSSR